MFRNLTNFATCIETIGCFNPRAPADYLLEGDDGYLLRGIANTLNITDEICTNGTQLREGNHDKFNFHVIHF